MEVFGLLLYILLSIVVIMKVAWNILLPYFMYYHSIRNDTKRSWSVFPLIEFVPLVCMIAISAASTTQWIPNYWITAKYGIVLIMISYAHFVFVGFILGFILRIKRKKHDAAL